MKFEFWLKNENDSIDLLLPVTPKAYDISYGNVIEIVQATAIGDINISGNRRPVNISVEGFFSVCDTPYVNKQKYSVGNSMDYVDIIKKWIDNKAIIRLVIADINTTKINERFYIEEISYKESNETNGDINYKISLREYRQLEIVKIITNTLPRSVKETPKSNTYVVVAGDNLSKIARKVYGDANKWLTIYDFNKNIIGKNPNLIYPGQVYSIP